MTLEEIVIKAYEKEFSDYSENYEHETKDEYEAYGDTYCKSGTFITDESMEKCLEQFDADFDEYSFVLETLMENTEFMTLIKDLKDKALKTD